MFFEAVFSRCKTGVLKNICERLLLKLVQISPGLPFFDNLHLSQIGTYALFFLSQFTVLFANSHFTTIDTV